MRYRLWYGLVGLLTFGQIPAIAEERAVAVVIPRAPVVTTLPDDEVERRKALMEIAEQAARDGDHDSAADHADRAFEVLPDAKSALISARAHLERDRWTLAIERLLVASDLGGHGPDRDAVLALLAEVSRDHGMGFGTLRTQPTAALARLERWIVPLGSSFALSAGSHRMELTAAAHDSVTVAVVVEAGAVFSRDIALSPTHVRVETVKTVEERVLERDYLRYGPPWLVGAGGLLALGGVAAVGVGYFYEGGSTRDGVDTGAAEQSADLAFATSYALLGVAGAALIAGSIWWSVQDPPTVKAAVEESAFAPTRLHLAPWLGHEAGGMLGTWSF